MKDIHTKKGVQGAKQWRSRNRYTVTVDDDPIVHRVIEKVTGVPSMAFTEIDAFFARMARLRPMAIFVDFHFVSERLNGLDVLHRIKIHSPHTPVIMITADANVHAVSRALAAGADDFIRKPICGIELVARFQSRVMGARESFRSHVIRYADISLDPVSGRLKGNGQRRYVTPTESRMLVALMKAQGGVVSKELLKVKAWNAVTPTDNALVRKIHEIRKVISLVSRSVQLVTVYGKGFSLSIDPTKGLSLIRNEEEMA